MPAVFSFHWIFPDLVTTEDLFGQTSRFEQREAKNHRVGHRAEQRRVNIRRYPDAADEGCIDCHADHHQERLKCQSEQPSEVVRTHMTPFTVAHGCKWNRSKRSVEVYFYHSAVHYHCDNHRQNFQTPAYDKGFQCQRHQFANRHCCHCRLHYMKALGVEKNPDPMPGSLDVLQCKNGLDTIVEDYKTVPGWDNPYIQNHVVQPLQGALAVQDVELAYELPDAYFHIQTCDDGFDYTLYNKDFTERDGGILETDGDKPVQEAMTELLAEFGCDAAQGRIMDAAELREQADTAAEQQAEVLKEKLAAERPAPEETLSFYVAECLEFTFAGEFHDHLTMEEALEAYDKIPSERMNADKCIGFCIEEDGGFVGMYELVVNDKVQRENINSINYFRDDKLVQQAISDMEKLMEARQKSKEQERSSTKKSVLDALRSLKAKKQEQPAQEQDKPKKAKAKGMEL